MRKIDCLKVKCFKYKLLDSLVRPSMLTGSPSPTVVLAFTLTLYSEYDAKKEKKLVLGADLNVRNEND